MGDGVRTLVTGGIRSGKSAYAETLLAGSGAVTYLATAPAPTGDDADWHSRVAAHRLRRAAAWTTLECTDPASALRGAGGPLLLDSVGSWLTARLDAHEAWQDNGPGWREALTNELDGLADAVRGFAHDLVIVTEEVGLTLVSEHRSGRVFTDWLGTANQRLAAECDRVVLVVAGCPLVIKAP